jgi:endo-1,4-beta-D-glucanase Y
VKTDSGQHLSSSRFASDAHKKAYTQIKALKTILKIDLNNYFLKKLLMRPIDLGFKKIPDDFVFFYDVMHLPELMEKFKSRIDYEKWNFEKSNKIPLKKEKKTAL